MATKKISPRLSSSFEGLEEYTESQQQSGLQLSSSEREDRTREEVTKRFVKYHFVLLLLIMIGIPAYNVISYLSIGKNELSISLKDTLLTYSAVIGPTLGLVIAYYFKSKEK